VSDTSSESDLKRNLRIAEADEASSSKPDPSPGIPAEMRRQMEAAKERMKKYHAVYGQAAHGFGGGVAGEASRSEDR
jgi:hypothetical protein